MSRPKADNPKDKAILVRLSQPQYDRAQHIARMKATTLTSVFNAMADRIFKMSETEIDELFAEFSGMKQSVNKAKRMIVISKELEDLLPVKLTMK